jgi:hypothetical protein
MHDTTLKLATDLEDALGETKYHHLHSGIPNTVFMLFLLDRGSRTNDRDPSIVYNLYREFAHELHYFEVGHRPRANISGQEIVLPGQWYSKHRIHVGPLVSWLKYKLKGSKCFV